MHGDASRAPYFTPSMSTLLLPAAAGQLPAESKHGWSSTEMPVGTVMPQHRPWPPRAPRDGDGGGGRRPGSAEAGPGCAGSWREVEAVLL